MGDRGMVGFERLIESIEQGRFDYETAETIKETISHNAEGMDAEHVDRLLSYIGRNVYMDVWIYSFVLSVAPSIDLCNQFINYVQASYELNWQNKYFLTSQLISLLFQTPKLNCTETYTNTWKLLQTAFNECKKAIAIPMNRIPADQRDPDTVVVLVEQFLSEAHGPTKTVLDRCAILQSTKKKVLLINTAEMLSMAGAVHYFGGYAGNKIDTYVNLNHVNWKNHTIPFYQCEKDMPNLDEMQQLLNAIYRLKPSAIVLVGGTSLFAGLANELVPVLTVGTLTSTLAMTLSDYQMFDEKQIPQNMPIMEAMGIDKKKVIPGFFTYSLKEQKETVTRNEIGIPEDAFAIAVVGGRLDEEVTDEFLCMLERCDTEQIFVGLLGKCEQLSEKLSGHETLKDKVKYLGFCDDILSRIEHFDLYVNPIRRGGGTSAVEAMSKGIPVVTVNYGDVAGVVGKAFQCESYEEMAALIDRYREDKHFYEKQSQLAKQLADVFLDSKKEFCRIMDAYRALVMAEETETAGEHDGIQIALLHGAQINAGDYLIKERTKLLLKHYYPNCRIHEFCRNQRFSDDVVAAINENDIAVFSGGPGYCDKFYPELAPMRDSLEDIHIPMMMIGMGWFGYDGEPYTVYNDRFSEKMQRLLKRVEKDSAILGCRDFQSMHVLRNNGHQQVLMTGCPAWYDLDYLNCTTYTGCGIKQAKKICISDCGNPEHLPQLIEVMDFVRHFFGKDKELVLVVHRGMNQEVKDELMKMLEPNRITLCEIEGDADGFSVYNDCDIHIGFRVYAHIYNMSQRRLSILIEEDARGYGVNEALGLPHIRTFYPVIQNDAAIHMDNPELITQLLDYLFDLHENNYCQMNQAYSLMRAYFHNMERHIKSIEGFMGKGKKPRLSVIVPCYNVENYVERCLKSIIDQTIGIENMEVILVNDASTDSTLSILKTYEEQYPNNIHVIDLEQKGGPSRARNIGIEKANADYIAFVDSDDWIAPEMYEDLYVNGIIQGCDLAICGFDRPRQYGATLSDQKGKNGIFDIQNDDMRTLLLREYRTNVYPWNKIYKKSYFQEYRIWYPEGLCYEDNYVGFLMLLLCKKLYITEASYYHWFVNPTGITGQNKNMLDRLQVQKLLLDKTKQMNLYSKFKDEIEYNFYEKVFVECFMAYMKQSMLPVKEMQDLKDIILEQIPDIQQNPFYLGKDENDHMLVSSQVGRLLTETISQETVTDIVNACLSGKR